MAVEHPTRSGVRGTDSATCQDPRIIATRRSLFSFGARSSLVHKASSSNPAFLDQKKKRQFFQEDTMVRAYSIPST